MIEGVFGIQPISPQDKDWIRQLLEEHWGSPVVVVHATTYEVDTLPGFIAVLDGKRVGLLTYRIDGKACEIVTLNSLMEGRGIGSALINAVRKFATDLGCARLWLITTNDNLEAIGFYQRRGFVLAALHCDAVKESRKIKPEIPALGNHNIPIRDEIEMELLL